MNLVRKLKTKLVLSEHGHDAVSEEEISIDSTQHSEQKPGLLPLQNVEHLTQEVRNLRNQACGSQNPGLIPVQNVEHLTQEVRNLRNQVHALEEELEKQKRLKIAFRTHAGNLGDYLKACLQALEDKNVPEHEWKESAHVRGTEDPVSYQRVLLLKEQAHQNGWYISENEIELCNEIGSGATSDIFKGIWHGLEVAVKQIRPSFFSNAEKPVDTFCQELELLSRIRHPNVVQFLGACILPPTHAWIVMECISSGTLTEWLHGAKKRSSSRIIPLPPLRHRLCIALGIAQGMQYLHERDPKVLHRDLKPSNVFVDKNGGVRIADFGFAKLLNSGQSALTGETGTYIYMAPEVVRHEPYTEKCDVYSFGVLLCELMTGFPPYIDSQLTPPEIAFAVARGILRPTLPQTISHVPALDKKLIALMKSAWDQEPSNRPSFATITKVMKTLMTSQLPCDDQ